VLSVSGEDTDFTSVDERKVNDAFKNENTIILTCGKLTTGVTLPMLDTIWYFKNTASAEQFIQILFRTMTPCDGKTDATMYCFDSEASLKVVKEYATVRLDEMSTNISKGENDTYQTVISDILSCINFTYLSGKYQWESEDPDDYFEKLHKLPYSHSVVAAFQNFSSFDGVEDIGTEELKEKDLTITKAQGEATKGQCDRNNKLKQLFRESKSSNDDVGERERTSNKVVKQLLKLLLNIDKKIFVNDFVKSYKDLEKLMPEELKGYKDNYIQLLEDNKARLNQMIEDIRYKESHGKVDELLQGFSYSNSTDMKTPEALLDKMFGKFSNYNGTICDPCVGVGTMLRYAVEKCGFKKENCYGIDINEDNVKICRKLGFVNIIPGDAQDPKTWEKLNMNFDKIIMNPPYTTKVEKGRKRALDLDFPIYKEACRHSKDVVCLMRRSQKYKKDGEYTGYWETDEDGNDITFDGVGVEVAIFQHKIGFPTLTIKSKYELNGKLDWIKQNDLTRKTTTLWHLIDRDWDKFKLGEPVPKGYVALNEVSTKNFTVFTEGEVPLKKNGEPLRMLIYIRTSNSIAMKKWLLEYVNPLHNDFRRFGDNNIDRGFTRTIEVPDELIGEA
jgi:predicted RNA methylase